ncbi:TetR/AcrR family transcriptional regulator [Pseudonocardia sp. TRM90224]|uniref:TetR/AcrR family transcriptional regulator n=1 Tax=Pseudonocardia sp. TRM90224 TaxID=2812678 RepID=UPI001E4C5745|nr:helix-turn-helix domain-containing protein [Pseudonocardia sp. TRM90224]
MTEDVKAGRRYDASRRQQQARETRARVLVEAGRLFLEKGYVETSMPDIARSAGVSVQTVYKAFANKATLLKAVYDISVVGDDEPVAMADRDAIAEVVAEPDARRKIELYARHLVEIMPRTSPLLLLARNAAGADPAAAAVWEQMRAEMLGAMTLFGADLRGTGQVRGDISPDEVRDILWTLHAPEVYELLVVERGWSAARYGAFVAGAMINGVVAPRA